MKYIYAEDTGHKEHLKATNLDEALTEAERLLQDVDWDASEGTIWPSASVLEMEENEDGDVQVDSHVVVITVHPDEPECDDSDVHDWQSPYEVVGGIRENPGVYGHGGGVIITEVCAHCGVYRVRNTWAQDRATGAQGLESIHYDEADARSLVWVQGRRVREAKSLDDLQDALEELDYLQQRLDSENPGADAYALANVRRDDLPAFGGDEPDDTTGIFSWDDGRYLVEGWEIVDRAAHHDIPEPTNDDFARAIPRHGLTR